MWRFSDDLVRRDSGERFRFEGWKDGGESIALEDRNGGRLPAELVRFGGGETGRIMGVDCDLAFSSISLSPESRLSYTEAVVGCGANMAGGAEGEGGRTVGVSDLIGPSPSGVLR